MIYFRGTFMKKLLLTIVCITATLAKGVIRSPREILNDLHPTSNQTRTAGEVIKDAVYRLHPLRTPDTWSSYSSDEILDMLQKNCMEVTHYGPAFPDAVKKEKELKKNCKNVLKYLLIEPFKKRFNSPLENGRVKNDILLEELKDLQKEMLQPFNDRIKIFEKNK